MNEQQQAYINQLLRKPQTREVELRVGPGVDPWVWLRDNAGAHDAVYELRSGRMSAADDNDQEAWAAYFRHGGESSLDGATLWLLVPADTDPVINGPNLIFHLAQEDDETVVVRQEKRRPR